MSDMRKETNNAAKKILQLAEEMKKEVQKLVNLPVIYSDTDGNWIATGKKHEAILAAFRIIQRLIRRSNLLFDNAPLEYIGLDDNGTLYIITKKGAAFSACMSNDLNEIYHVDFSGYVENYDTINYIVIDDTHHAEQKIVLSVSTKKPSEAIWYGRDNKPCKETTYQLYSLMIK